MSGLGRRRRTRRGAAPEASTVSDSTRATAEPAQDADDEVEEFQAEPDDGEGYLVGAEDRPREWPPNDWAGPFFAALRKCYVVAEACRAVRLNRDTPYKRAERDPEFKDEWEGIIQDRNGQLVRTMWNRAIEGDVRPVVVHEFVDERIGSGQDARVVRHRRTRVVQQRTWDTGLQKFLALTQMRDQFGPKVDTEDERDKAARAAALLGEMMSSVPEWIEGVGEDAEGETDE